MSWLVLPQQEIRRHSLFSVSSYGSKVTIAGGKWHLVEITLESLLEQHHIGDPCTVTISSAQPAFLPALKQMAGSV